MGVEQPREKCAKMMNASTGGDWKRKKERDQNDGNENENDDEFLPPSTIIFSNSSLYTFIDHDHHSPHCIVLYPSNSINFIDFSQILSDLLIILL